MESVDAARAPRARGRGVLWDGARGHVVATGARRVRTRPITRAFRGEPPRCCFFRCVVHVRAGGVFQRVSVKPTPIPPPD